MSRGIVWIVWGNNERVEKALPRSVESARKWHPDIEQKVIRVPGDHDLRLKASMYSLARFTTALYLDADVVVMGDLSHGFEMAERHGMALCINPCPWARRYAGLRDSGEMTEYDSGVVFFCKRYAVVRNLFETWRAGYDMNSSSDFMSAQGLTRMPVNDQCSLASAFQRTGFNPHVLPVNYNLHPKWNPLVFGPVRCWHDYNDPPKKLEEWNEEQSKTDAVLSLCKVEVV